MRVGKTIATLHTSPAKELAASALFAAAVVLASLPASGHGEDRPRRVPKDGSWVRYHVETENGITGEKKSHTITLSFVGTVVEDGQTCRWLETKSVLPEGADGAYILKVLVPEKEFWESETPFAHPRRAWGLGPNEKAIEFPARFLARDANTALRELLLWTPGMLKNSFAATDKPKDIEYRPGRLIGSHLHADCPSDHIESAFHASPGRDTIVACQSLPDGLWIRQWTTYSRFLRLLAYGSERGSFFSSFDGSTIAMTLIQRCDCERNSKDYRR